MLLAADPSRIRCQFIPIRQKETPRNTLFQGSQNVIATSMMIATGNNAGLRSGFPLVRVGTKGIGGRFLPDSDWS